MNKCGEREPAVRKGLVIATNKPSGGDNRS